MSQGELASTTVITRFVEWFEHECPRFLSENADAGSVDLNGLEHEWGDLLSSLNDDIRAYGEQKGEYLGTTFTGMMICGKQYFIAHVGDCRAYRFTRQNQVVLTHDQTLAVREVDQGLLTPEQAMHHEHSNVLLQAVGTQDGLTPDFILGEAGSDDLFMLCCDGFYRSLSDERISTGFTHLIGSNERQMRSTCEQLAQESISAGSTDNVTVMCFMRAGVEVAGDDSTTSTLVSSDSALEEPTSVLGSFSEATTTLIPADAEATTTLASTGEERTTTLVSPGEEATDVFAPLNSSDQTGFEGRSRA